MARTGGQQVGRINEYILNNLHVRVSRLRCMTVDSEGDGFYFQGKNPKASLGI